MASERVRPTEIYEENIRLKEVAMQNNRGDMSQAKNQPITSCPQDFMLLNGSEKPRKTICRRIYSGMKYFAVILTIFLLCVLTGLVAYTVAEGKARHARLHSMKIKIDAIQEANEQSQIEALIAANATTTTESPDNQPMRENSMYLYNIGSQAGDPNVIRDCYGPYLKQSFPDLDYAFFGYNILRGYPLAIGHDPGLTLPIFAADYDKTRFTADCRYSLPQGISAAPDVSCVTSFTSTVVQNAYEFSKSLSTSAKVSGGGWGVKFSASSGFQESSSSMASGESLFIISEARCNYYFSKLDPIRPPPLDPSFLEFTRKLEDLDNEENYFKFFSYYGTHFIKHVVFGARYTQQHKMSASTYKSEKSKGVNVRVSASYSGLSSVGGSFSMDSSQREQASSFRESVQTTTITVGAPPPANGDAMTWASTVKDTPVPMSYKLESIEELFTETYMKNHNISYNRIYGKIQILKISYCEYLRGKGEVDSCESLVPYIEIKGLEINGWVGKAPTGVSKSTCINLCLRDDDCIEAEFTEGVDMCELNHPSHSHTIFKNDKATLMIFTTKLLISRQNLRIEGAKIIADIPFRAKKPEVRSISDCEHECDDDPICSVFTYCSVSDCKQPCILYSDKSLGYDPTPLTVDEADNFVTVFVARKPVTTTTSTTSTSTTLTTSGATPRA